MKSNFLRLDLIIRWVFVSYIGFLSFFIISLLMVLIIKDRAHLELLIIST